MTNEYSEAVSETLEILKYLDDELLNKIPLEVIKKLKKQKLDSYINKFENKLELDKITDKAKDILAVLYREYIANEEEKIEFDKMLNQNDLKGDGKDYTIKKLEEQQKSKDEFLPVVVKKSFIQKVFEKLFKKNI